MLEPLGPTALGFLLLLGLALFFGLAFEEFHAATGLRRPGGIRTFPLLALAGGLLYLLDTTRLLALVAGLLVLGLWLALAYRQQMREPDPGQNSVELIVPTSNLLAFLVGPVALAMPPWIAVATTVVAVLLLTARQRLHDWAQRIEMGEIVTAAKFLIYKVWLALLAVCTMSYASYLLQRFLAPSNSDLAIAFLGGLYSSTATTVVLARNAGAQPATNALAQAGIMLATAVMYLRILVIIAIFDPVLARGIAPVMAMLCAIGLILAALHYRRARGKSPATASAAPRNPLEISAAVIFAVLFVVISIATQWARSRFGTAGVDTLAAVVGFTDIDPFVLSLAQGGTGTMPLAAATTAILIAIASNNVLKAAYAIAFAGWRNSSRAAAVLVALAVIGIGAAFFV
jgi:uncharacterized membrane protein (DUF4010 family)